MSDPGRSQGGLSIVGREAELARLDRFLREARSGSSIVLIGAPGIGKTTLWEAAVCAARGRGDYLLVARPGESAAPPPFAGVIDLCDHIDEAVLATLPMVQRRALEEALRRAEPAGAPGAMHLATLGLLGIVRALAARRPVVVAIDDVQWLDRPSADAVAFLARRLEDGRVTFLLARRPGPVGSLEAVLSRAVIGRLQIGPLSFGAVRKLLFERLGLTVSRQRLRQIVDATGGNPLFALEVGRALLDDPERWVTDDLPLPGSLEEMLSERVSRLAPAVQRVLLAVALCGDPRVDQVLSIVDAGALDDAVHAGVVVVDGQRVRPVHPLLVTAAELAAQQDHPWATASSKRCAGLLELATGGDVEAGAASVAEASVDLEGLGARFDAARCLLALGRAQRRLKQWGVARESLERAAVSFAALGADGWDVRARSELERVGGRRRAEGELTASERQVSEFAADGLSNKEIAAALYVTVNTVEVHLTRAYTKLGVRSRAQLAKRLARGS